MTQPFAYRWRGSLHLFAAIALLYLFSTSRERPWGDATPIWEVADSIAHSHNFHAKTRWPPSLANGKDGHLYGLAPLFQCVVHVPGAFLQRQLAKAFPSYWQISWRFTSHLASTLLGTLACILFFGLCRRLRMRPIPAALSTVALAFASSVWVYSRYPYSETLQLVCFTGFFGKLLDVRERPTWREAGMLGVWAGLLVNAKPVFVLSGLGAGLFLVWELRRNWRALLLVSLVSLASAVPFGAIYLWYNYIRWGSIYFTGYGLVFAGSAIATGGAAPAVPVMIPHETPLVGLWGMFMSPGKSVFLYSPPLVASLLGFLRFFRRFRHIVLAMILTILPCLYVHAQMISWAGDYAWGPRYLTFALAVLLLPAGFLLEDVLANASKLRRWLGAAALTLCLLLGAFVTYLGNVVYWDHYIRIQGEAVQGWLGVPDNTGDGISTPTSPCPVCFETLYSLQWLPGFNHILGNYWLFTHLPANHSWVEAEADAPWRRYTNLHVNIQQNYNRARIDWWFVEYRHTFPTLAWTLVIALPTLSAVFLLLFLLEVRRSVLGLRKLAAPAAGEILGQPPAGEVLSAST
ncbi:MAG: hypothetical protein JXP73_18020 [Deltaproteobacteria bacterium]|nr:hypothetical protein [Deltaproteobacteria bacterium]